MGISGQLSSRDREALIIDFLDEIKPSAERIFLVGDVWDFYYEYNKVVPKGQIRLLGKLAELVDYGIAIDFFKGNHDMWMFRYLHDEIGITIHENELETTLDGKKFYIAHGDGLGPGDQAYKFLKRIFRSHWAQFLFRWIHPDLGISIADFWSRKSRAADIREDNFDAEKEWLVSFCQSYIREHDIDYFIFGHRHMPIHCYMDHTEYINLGDWLQYQTYAVLEEGKISLKAYKNDACTIQSCSFRRNE